MPPCTDGDGSMGVLVALKDLQGYVAEMQDEAAPASFGSFSPAESGLTAGAGWPGPLCAQRTSSGHIALQAKPKAARPAISAPVQSEGGIFTHAFTHGTAGSAFTPHSLPLSPTQGNPEAVAAVEQHQMVTSYLQHHCSSRAARAELTEAAYSSVLMPKAAQQHQQLVPNPMQYHSHSSSQMPVAQQVLSVMPQATQHPMVGQHQCLTLREHPYPWQQSQYVPAATLQYSFSSPSHRGAMMSAAQQAEAAYASAAISEAASALLIEARDFAPNSLKAIFVNCVMCDYTPRNPRQLPSSRWTSLQELVSKLEKHAPVEVRNLGHQNLRQIITEWYKDHPKFRELPFSAWGKRLKDKTPGAHPRSLSFKFCFEHTPEGGR